MLLDRTRSLAPLALICLAAALTGCPETDDDVTNTPGLSTPTPVPVTDAPTDTAPQTQTPSATAGEPSPTHPPDTPSMSTDAPTPTAPATATEAPTIPPTAAPTPEPTAATTPTTGPTDAPTAEPTQAPTAQPTQAPTAQPTQAPTNVPTAAPTPTATPTRAPTPTATPTRAPTPTAQTDADGDGHTADVDCDDADAAIHPGATEICDEVDQDCDSTVDEEASDAGTWYTDNDDDEYGAEAVTGCNRPDNTAEVGGDCNDADPAIHPGAEETCDEVDQDCDTAVDEEATDAVVYYVDGDGDTYGSGDPSAPTCEAPGGSATIGGDCDDDNAGVYPGAEELCSAIDEDCDGAIDEGVMGTGASCPAVSCAAILDDGGTSDGLYHLTSTGGQVYETYCDQTRDAGGWTLVASVVNEIFTEGSHLRQWDTTDAWMAETTFGTVASRQTTDYKGLSFTDVPGQDVLVVTDEYAFEFDGVLAGDDFATHVSAHYNPDSCSTSMLGSGADWYEELSETQALAHSWVIRPKDTNATCFPTGNESAIIGNQITECCWTPGMGNTPAGYPTWDDYDLSLLQLDRLSAQACTPGEYTCNEEGYRFTNGSSCYEYNCKVVYAEIYVR